MRLIPRGPALGSACVFAITLSMLSLWGHRGQAASALRFTDINPDQSGPLPGCAAPCASGGSGGRVHHLATSPARPDEIYAASELGGLFKTRNGGISWRHLDRHVPSKTWDVAVDPGGLNVYATSFYDGRVSPLSGIEVSDDAGRTWTHPPSATPPEGLCAATRRKHPTAFGIAIRPDASNEVLVGTNCGLARSSDWGASWDFVDPTPDDLARSVWDVAALPGGLTYICGQAGVFRSPDGGAHWQQLPDPSDASGSYRGYCSIAVEPDFPDLVFLVFSRQLYFDPIVDIRESAYFASFDGGAHWILMPHPDAPHQKRVPMVATNRRSYGLDIWVGAGNLYRIPCIAPFTSPSGCPVRDRTLWDGSFTDGEGDRAKAHGDTGDLLFDPNPSVDACPVFYSSDGGIYRNVEFASPACQAPHFAEANVGLHAELLLGMGGADLPGAGAEGLYTAAQDIGAFGTLDAPASRPTWKHGADGDVFDVVADAGQALLDVPHYGGEFLERADPDLANRVQVPGTQRTAHAFFTVFTDVVDQWGPDSYAVLVDPPSGPDVRFTTNLNPQSVSSASVAWTSLGWPASSFPCGLQASQNFFVRFYVMAGPDKGGCLWRSQNELWSLTPGFGPWKRLDITNDSACPDGGFGIFAADPGRVWRLYASCTSTDPPRMVRSNDGGDTWQVDQKLTDLMTGPGVFVPKWSDPSDFYGGAPGFGGVQPVMVAFDPEDEQLIVAGGYDSGLFISSDGGKGWARLAYPPARGTVNRTPELPRPFYAYFDHEGGGRLRALYIGSVGRGVWRIKLARTDLKLDVRILRTRPSGFPRRPKPCRNCRVLPDSRLDYLVRIDNAGSGVAGNAVFEGRLGDGLVFQELHAPRNWNCSTPGVGAGGTVRCTTAQIQRRRPVTVVIGARVRAEVGTNIESEFSVVSNAIDRQPANSYVNIDHRVQAASGHRDRRSPHRHARR